MAAVTSDLAFPPEENSDAPVQDDLSETPTNVDSDTIAVAIKEEHPADAHTSVVVSSTSPLPLSDAPLPTIDEPAAISPLPEAPTDEHPHGSHAPSETYEQHGLDSDLSAQVEALVGDPYSDHPPHRQLGASMEMIHMAHLPEEPLETSNHDSEHSSPAHLHHHHQQQQQLANQRYSPEHAHDQRQSSNQHYSPEHAHGQQQHSNQHYSPEHAQQAPQHDQEEDSHEQYPSSITPSGQDLLDRVKLFLATAPTNWDPEQTIKRFTLPNGEHISCVLWNNLFHITGTDIVRSLVFRFQGFGRPVRNVKKFEEGVFSDLRNLKPGIDATLEEPRSEFLDMLYKNNCIRTQKKQKVFYWFSVPHDRLFMDALERDLKREALGIESTTVALHPMALIPTLELAKQQCMPTLQLKPEMMGLSEGNLAMEDWINDSPTAGGLPQVNDQQAYTEYGALNASPNPAPYLTNDMSPEMSVGAPSLSSQMSDDGDAFGSQHPPAAGYGVFSLFEGSPNYKQRRRAQSLFSLSKGYQQQAPYQPSTPPPPEPEQDFASPPQRKGESKRNYLCSFKDSSGRDACGRKFKRYEHLRRHMRCHTGEKPYVCPVVGCNKEFSRSDNLSQHLKVHNGTSTNASASLKGSPTPSIGVPLEFAHNAAGRMARHQQAHSLPTSPMMMQTALGGSPMIYQMSNPGRQHASHGHHGSIGSLAELGGIVSFQNPPQQQHQQHAYGLSHQHQRTVSLPTSPMLHSQMQQPPHGMIMHMQQQQQQHPQSGFAGSGGLPFLHQQQPQQYGGMYSPPQGFAMQQQQQQQGGTSMFAHDDGYQFPNNGGGAGSNGRQGPDHQHTSGYAF